MCPSPDPGDWWKRRIWGEDPLGVLNRASDTGALGKGLQDLWTSARAGPALAEALALVTFLSDRRNRAVLVENLYRLAGRVRDQIPFDELVPAWASARQLISLQARLLFEQAFWLLGPPYSKLVTGFRPVDMGLAVDRADEGGAEGEGESEGSGVQTSSPRRRVYPPGGRGRDVP